MTRRPIIERPSPNFSARRGSEIDCIVMHDTGCHEVGRPLSRMSVHYVVDRDGTIYRCVNEQDAAWHAGDSMLEGAHDVDARSIGVELVGFPATNYMPCQLDAVVELCLSLCLRYRIPVERIVGHADIVLPAGRKADPGPHFPWQRVRERITMAVTASIA